MCGLRLVPSCLRNGAPSCQWSRSGGSNSIKIEVKVVDFSVEWTPSSTTHPPCCSKMQWSQHSALVTMAINILLFMWYRGYTCVLSRLEWNWRMVILILFPTFYCVHAAGACNSVNLAAGVGPGANKIPGGPNSVATIQVQPLLPGRPSSAFDFTALGLVAKIIGMQYLFQLFIQ